MAGEIQEYTERLIEALGLRDQVHQSENQIYSFELKGNLVIQFADLHPGLNLMSFLAPMPDVEKETFLMSLLRVNLFGSGTGGGVLGYDDEAKLLTFSMAKPYLLSYQQFKESIEDFINYVELYKEELRKVAHGEKSLLAV